MDNSFNTQMKNKAKKELAKDIYDILKSAF